MISDLNFETANFANFMNGTNYWFKKTDVYFSGLAVLSYWE
jgi:hypothetical protein